MKQHLYALLVVLFAASACSNEEASVTETVEPSDNKELVWAFAGMRGSVPMTRLNLKPVTTTTTGEDETQVTLNTLSVTWESSKEGFSVFPSNNSGSYAFTQKNIDPDHHKAAFSGYMTPEEGADYFAFYPVTTSTDATNITLNMTEQNGQLNGKKVYMYDSSKLDNNTLDYLFEHLTAVLELTMVFPSVSATVEVQDMESGGSVTSTATRGVAGKSMTNVTFSAEGLAASGTADITLASDNVISTTQGDITFGNATFTITEDTPPTAKVYLHLLPATLTDFTVTVKVGNSTYKGEITPSCEIEEGYFYTGSVNMVRQLSPGDLMLKNGAIIDPDDYTADMKSLNPAIGVVAYLYDEDTPEKQKVKFGDDNTPAKGLVMALKNTSTSKIAWSSDNSLTLGTGYQMSSYQDAYQFMNGYDLCKLMQKNSNYLAANSALNYKKTVPAPDNTSSWYLPSIGEWMMILGANGIGKCVDFNSGSDQTTVIKNVTAVLTPTGTNGKDYETIPTSSYFWWWSANEYKKIPEYAYVVRFQPERSYVTLDVVWKHNQSSFVRAILAF